MADEERDNLNQEKAALRTKAFRRRLILLAAVIVVVLAGVFAARQIIRRWTYSSLETIRTDAADGAASFLYSAVDGNILRCARDGAALLSRQNETIWEVGFEIQSPAVVSCGEICAVYDRNGTTAVICDRKGEIGRLRTGQPIIRASVAENGGFAAMMEDATGTWIQYYSPDGVAIASIRTTMDDPGYPLDLALSEDGMMLMVSYLAVRDGIRQGLVCFYEFGEDGKNRMDNRIASYTYTDCLIPDVEFLDNGVSAAFRENGLTVFTGGRTPVQQAEIDVEGEILSVFRDAMHVGLIISGSTPDNTRLLVVDLAGKTVLDTETDFPVRNAELFGNRVNLYNGPQLCVYDLSGSLKYSGGFPGSCRQLFAVDDTRYVAVTEGSLHLLQLR